MFIPIYDTNKLEHVHLQYVTVGLIAINFMIWLVTAGFGEASEATRELILGFGFIPALINDLAVLPSEIVVPPESATYISYAFLHTGFWHLASNMLFLWVFGDNVEDAMGHGKYLLFFLLCAAAGAFAHAFLYPGSQSPLIGASGAVAGIVAAYLVLHPKVKIWVLFLGKIPIKLPAIIPLALWGGLQVYNVVTDSENVVSWAAHIGGFICGITLLPFLKRPGVVLFDRDVVS